MIKRCPSCLSDLIETNSHQHGTSDMIAMHSLDATLIRFKPSYLLGLTVKLLNLPTDGTLLTGCIGRMLRMVIGAKILRALGRQRNPEQFHLMAFGNFGSSGFQEVDPRYRVNPCSYPRLGRHKASPTDHPAKSQRTKNICFYCDIPSYL